MCHPEPTTGQILDWKTNKPQNVPRIIYDRIWFEISVFSYAENLDVQ